MPASQCWVKSEIMGTIFTAETDTLIRTVSELFAEYTRSLPFELDFQDFDAELADIGHHYALPRGRLYLAREGHHPAGCVALRDLGNGVCEMKRLYVRPAFRGRHIGRELAETVIEAARKIGYCHMRLDTVPAMKRANDLYAALGFKSIDAYRFNPVEGAVYLELQLNADKRDD